MARQRPRGDSKPTTGDLFEHYGVDERPREPGALPETLPARACPGCRWFVVHDAGDTCPQCGASIASTT